MVNCVKSNRQIVPTVNRCGSSYCFDSKASWRRTFVPNFHIQSTVRHALITV